MCASPFPLYALILVLFQSYLIQGKSTFLPKPS